MMYHLGCDFNNMPKTNPHSFGFTRSPYGVSRKCLFKKDIVEGSFKYTEEFFETYKSERKFFSIRINAAHEFTMQNNQYADLKLEKLLRNLDSKGHLEKTIVWIYSDHGQHINFLWKTESGYTEMMNPFMFVMVPKSLDEKIGANLEHNQQKLINHF